MKIRIVFLIAVAMTIAMGVSGHARGTNDEDESLGEKLKRFFVRPTPTPKPTPAQGSEMSTPVPSPKSSPARARKRTGTSVPAATRSPSPRANEGSAEASATPSVEPSPLAAPVSPVISSPEPSSSPLPTSTPSSPQSVRPIRPSSQAKASSAANTASVPKVTISPEEISDYESYSPEVRKIIDLALNLTTMNLGYKYGSADPANGGMDCSGFVYYALSKCGIQGVPRDAREQYVWVRKAGNFQAVLAHRDDTFELEALRPGDLLFWGSAYSVNRDPAITYTMIYLGREKATNRRIMVGASDGRTYKGQSRSGVSVFDFKVSPASATEDNRPAAVFVGYARIPGLPGG